MPLGDFISAGASLLGGLFGRKQTRSDNRQLLQHQDRWNQRSLDFATRQFESGIQTRVADAKKAGIHPLFALGASGGGGSPSFSVGGGVSGNALGEGIARAGASLGRAAGRDPLARELHNAQVANLEAQTAKSNAEALYFASEARKGVNGVGLGYSGSRAGRAADLLWEIANIRGSLASRRERKSNGAGAGSSRTSPSRSPRGNQSPGVISSPLGRVVMNPEWSDAEAAEQRYGDIAQELFGLPLMMSELAPAAAESIILGIADAASGRDVTYRGRAREDARLRKWMARRLQRGGSKRQWRRAGGVGRIK